MCFEALTSHQGLVQLACVCHLASSYTLLLLTLQLLLGFCLFGFRLGMFCGFGLRSVPLIIPFLGTSLHLTLPLVWHLFVVTFAFCYFRVERVEGLG